MEIQFLYYEDCPSHTRALDRLRSVLTEEGVQHHLKIIKVDTRRQAQELRFTGSPTIRVNGEDIDPPASDAQYGLACRAYQTADGRVSPLPSPSMIQSAVRRARR